MNELTIRQKIYEIRGQHVMLDRDLAALYGVETRALNQAVKRNIKRFEGDDFMFQLTKDEAYHILPRSQNVILNNGRGDILHDQNDINESTRAQLDAISEALAELQQGSKAIQHPRRRIGFIQDETE